ncbi:MAG: HlyD family efflux transporter periplasmic adaptor subunit [Sphingobacteriales bacterium]|nr:MAG: HlyD family efflux transporter periplasmic adaptor subunit [Sphingobacteriales bacterium]
MVNFSIKLALVTMLLVHISCRNLDNSIVSPQLPAAKVIEINKVDLIREVKIPALVSNSVIGQIGSYQSGTIVDLRVRIGDFVQIGKLLGSIQNQDESFQPYRLRSPLKGVVTFLSKTKGDFVQKSDPIVTIESLEKPIVTIWMAPFDLAQVSTGIKASLRVNDEVVSLVTETVSPILDPTTGLGRVELRSIRSWPKSIRAGSAGQVTYKFFAGKGYYVPDTAIVYRGKVPSVRIIDQQSRIRFSDISILTKNEGETSFVAELGSKAKVVSDAPMHLMDGDFVGTL